MNDELWMKHALKLSERGRGYVEPNPLVGAVIVSDGRIVGEGWHQKYGEAHAEINALTQAGAAARGATVYVTLEPCCHHGQTPPCTDALVAAGVARVVAAMQDPFPKVVGRGRQQLEEAGVAVDIGLCEQDAKQLNAPYLKLLSTQRPYVHAKWAMSLDGKIATHTGDSQWISNEASRRRVHELRGRMDAIIVGSRTARLDDPLLTARPSGPRVPVRIVLDSQAQTPLASNLVTTAKEVPTILVTAGHVDPDHREKLERSGCEILTIDDGSKSSNVTMLLDELGRRRMTNILVEGGSETFGSFLNGGEIDEVHVFIAPRLIGGRDAPSPMGNFGVEKIIDSLQLDRWQVEMVEGDVYIRGWTTAKGDL